jgi:hypothetical protein
VNERAPVSAAAAAISRIVVIVVIVWRIPRRWRGSGIAARCSAQINHPVHSDRRTLRQVRNMGQLDQASRNQG